jgi:hypothetical protein
MKIYLLYTVEEGANILAYKGWLINEGVIEDGIVVGF